MKRALLLVLLLTTPAYAQYYEPGSQAQNFGTAQVSVATTATLVETNRVRNSVTIVNLGTNQICLGQTSAVSLTNGLCLPGTVGASVTIPYSGAVWGIAATGATTVSVMDIY